MFQLSGVATWRALNTTVDFFLAIFHLAMLIAGCILIETCYNWRCENLKMVGTLGEVALMLDLYV